MRSNNKQHEILRAAFAVVAEQGANRLTIDAVAAESGFSKGGVLYHFSSKKALLSGMLDYLVNVNVSRVEEQKDSHLLTRMIAARQATGKAERSSTLALLTAFAEDTKLLEPARSQMNQLFQESVETKTEKEEAATLFFANEGLRFLQLFDLCPLNHQATRKLTVYLTKRAENLQ